MEEYITLDEFRLMDEYQDFIKEYPDTGVLRVRVFTMGGVIPLSNTNILIMKKIGNYQVLFYNGKTDSVGFLGDIVLPAPKKDLSSTDIPVSTNYEMSAIHLGYQDIQQYTISIYGGITVIQYVRMIPEVKPNV
ncbi:MAG: hypothetical protein IKF71_04290 [Bacilli bacterium]|nr:hypothetical protein [Bacilli bacterium]